MPTHSLKTLAFILCLFLCLGSVASLYAGGQAEPRLAEAERLIEQKNYSEALKLLAAIQRDNPELRDEVANLMAQIMAVTQRYNVVLSQLNKARAEEDVSTMQKLLPELQKIDPQRSVELSGTAGIYVGFLQLMNQTGALLDAGKPVDALQGYLLPFSDPKKAGFSLPVQDFEGAGYGSIIVARTESDAALIVAKGNQEVAAAAGIALVAAAVKSLLASKATADSLPSFEKVMAPILEAATAEGAIRATSAALEEINRSIRETTQKGKDDSYIQYLIWLCSGRSEKNEGIVLAIHAQWEQTVRDASAAAYESAMAAFDAARKQYDAGAFDAASDGFTDAFFRCLLAVKGAAIASSLLQTSSANGWTFASGDADFRGELITRVSMAQESADEVGAYRTLMLYKREYARMLAVTPDAAVDKAHAAEEIAKITAARSSLAARVEEARAEQRDWLARAEAWQRKQSAGAAPEEASRRATAIAGFFSGFADTECQQRDLQYALRIATIGGNDFQGTLEAAIADRTKGESLMAGTAEGAVSLATGEAVKRPDMAIELFTTVSASLDTLIEGVTAHIQKLQAEKPYVLASAGYAVLLDGAASRRGYNDILANARKERDGVDPLISAAQKQIDDAAIASKRGDSAYLQAIAAYNQKDPDGASRFVDDARKAYSESIESAYTEHASTMIETDLTELGTKIEVLNRQIALENAQKALASINKRIAEKDFLGASDELDAAERAWNDTGQETYTQFDIVRQNITNAVELSQGRELSRLDPTAAVVTAFMSNAQSNLAAGNVKAATQNVDDALSYAPNYGQAKVLKLMIQKQTNPVQFEKDAAAQIATYVKMARDSTNLQGQKDAYNALVDYSKISAQFAAQLKPTIQELEYVLGYVRRPATPQQVAQSNALVQEASALAQQGTQDGYTKALAKLKQALEINPDNSAAVRLDTQVRSTINNAALTALAAADNAVYNQAYNLYLSGAVQDAYDKVMVLWANARNQTYAPLQKLKKRCEVALNIS